MSLRYRQLQEEFPEAKKEEIIDLMAPEYERPGRTKQSFKDDTDINKILKKAQKAGTLSHLQKHGAFYGDFANAPADLFEAREQIERGAQIFAELPSELRREFRNDPLEYFQFVNDPANRDRLPEVLPEIAEPGRYFPDVSPRTPPGALLGDTSAPQGTSTATPSSGGASSGEVAPAGDSGGDSTP